MFKRSKSEKCIQRYCSYDEFCQIYGIGLTTARKFAKDHNLTVHIGRRVLIDLERAEQAMNDIRSAQESADSERSK